MEEFVIRSTSGRRSLVIRSDDDGDYWLARLSGEAVDAARRFYTLGWTGLADFFTDLAAQWRGWTGDKTWAAVEGDISIAASHDGLGTISLLVDIRDEPSTRVEPDWQASLVLTVDAGGLDDLARAAKRLG